MLRKGTIFIILISMMLHCAARMNFISYLYEHSEEIAFSLRLIDEIPIATCHHDYEFNKGLAIVTQDNDSNVPSTRSHVSEIILFFQVTSINVDLFKDLADANHLTILSAQKYSSPEFKIFHPPA